jgi:hypothetical protein
MSQLQPHPDDCPDCGRPCYASSIESVDPEKRWFRAGYHCSCGRRWGCGWSFSTLINDPDPTPLPGVYTPPRRAVVSMDPDDATG